MTTTGRIKVRIAVTVEVDPAEWAYEYACERSEVREDVRSYFTDLISQAPAISDAGLTVRVA